MEQQFRSSLFIHISGLANLIILAWLLIDTGNDFASEFRECTLPDNSLPMAGLWRKSEGQFCFFT